MCLLRFLYKAFVRGKKNRHNLNRSNQMVIKNVVKYTQKNYAKRFNILSRYLNHININVKSGPKITTHLFPGMFQTILFQNTNVFQVHTVKTTNFVRVILWGDL